MTPEHVLPAPVAGASGANAGATTSIYAFEPGELEVIPATASGNVAATAAFFPPSPGGICVGGAIDAALNAYVACPTVSGNAGAVVVFSTTSGPHPAVHTITGPHTGIAYATETAVGGPNGDIYVLEEAPLNGHNSTQILVFDKNASGDVPPKRRIVAGEFPFEAPCAVTDAFAIAVDPSGDVYITILPGGGSFIYEYAPTADGNAAPIASIVTEDSELFGLALDRSGNIYATDVIGNRILEFAAGANGPAAPVRIIGGADTGLFGPRSVAVDAAGEIFVGSQADVRGNISVFAPSASGNTAPIRTIGGPNVLPRTPDSLTIQ